MVLVSGKHFFAVRELDRTASGEIQGLFVDERPAVFSLSCQVVFRMRIACAT